MLSSSAGRKQFVSTDPLAGIDLSNGLDAPQGNGKLRAALVALKDGVAAVPGVPAGFRQQVNAAVDSSLTLSAALPRSRACMRQARPCSTR